MTNSRHSEAELAALTIGTVIRRTANILSEDAKKIGAYSEETLPILENQVMADLSDMLTEQLLERERKRKYG